MSKNSIWGFSGNLICLSIDLTKEATDVPSQIKVFYMPDVDSLFDPLYLLLIDSDVTVVCADKEMQNKLSRTIGSNRDIVFQEDMSKLVRSIL